MLSNFKKQIKMIQICCKIIHINFYKILEKNENTSSFFNYDNDKNNSNQVQIPILVN